MSKTIKRIAAAVLPVAAAASIAAVVPGTANAAGCTISAGKPYNTSQTRAWVDATVSSSGCGTVYGEIYRWVNGSPVRVVSQSSTNGTVWVVGAASKGCWTYYTKGFSGGVVVRSAGATVCY